MNTRRQFLISAPLGVLGVIAACNDGAHESSGVDSVASGSAAPVAGAATATAATPTSVANIPADAATLSWIPQHKDLVYTFGGATPRQHIKSGTRIVTWTEDCFDGAVKTAADLPSKKWRPATTIHRRDRFTSRARSPEIQSRFT